MQVEFFLLTGCLENNRTVVYLENVQEVARVWVQRRNHPIITFSYSNLHDYEHDYEP